MEDLFGNSRATNLRRILEVLKPHERELTIVEEIAEALKEMGGEYVLPFGFKDDRGARTTHHLIFVTKHFRGYEIMKEIMAKESSASEQGIASFEYSPADIRQPLLFSLSRPLDDLENLLLHDFSGQRVTLKQIYEKHSIGKRYIEKNYTEALRKLETNEKIIPDIPASQRRKWRGQSVVKDVFFTFPLR